MSDVTDETKPGQATTPGKPTRRRTSRKPSPDGDAQGMTPGSDGAAQAAAPALPPAPQVPPPPGGAQPPASTPARPTFGERLGRTVRRVFGWLVAAVFGLAIGIALFVFVPPLFNQVVAPVRANTADITQLEAEIAGLEARLAELQATQAESVVEQDAVLLEAQSAVTERVAEAEGRMAETEARLTETEAHLRDAEDRLSAQDTLIADLEKTLEDYAAQLEALSGRLDTVEGEVPGAAEYAEYNRQLLLMRAWQEVLRVRLRLMENNPGQALEELGSALATLDEVYALSSAEQQAALAPIIERLDGVVVEIEENPFAATGDLEIAWHDLGQLIGPLVPGEAPEAAP